MNGQALGGGVMLAVGAMLWAVYFLPTWTKRRQFSAAQKNALRIHRTLRILAETSEIPTEVRVEATARQALAHERMLEATGRSEVAQHEAKLAEARLAERKAILEARATKRRADALKRELIRQTQTVKVLRIVAAALTIGAFVGLIAGVVLAIVGMGSLVLGLSAGVGLVSILGLVAMAPRVQPAVNAVQAPQNAVRRTSMSRESAAPVSGNPEVSARARSTAHQPRVRVAHQQRVASQDEITRAQQLLEQARRQAEQSARAAHPVVNSTAQTEARVVQRAPQRPGSPARPASVQPNSSVDTAQAPKGVDLRALQSMGIVTELQQDMPDLDAALMRRRAAG